MKSKADLSDAVWTKSSRSQQSGECVEVTRLERVERPADDHA